MRVGLGRHADPKVMSLFSQKGLKFLLSTGRKAQKGSV